MNPFSRQPLQPVPLGKRLAGVPAMQNAAIELENLLAEGGGGGPRFHAPFARMDSAEAKCASC
jgi:hypothetical protein